MEKTINYMVLRYMPSFIRQENIIVGLAFHVPEDKRSFFVETSSYKRVRSFDDELDDEMYKADMDSFHEAFDYPYYKGKLDTYGYFDFGNIQSDSFLADRGKTFSNEYRFDKKVLSIKTDVKELENDIEGIKDIYLYYDKPKGKRISNANLNSMLSKIFKSKFDKTEINQRIDRFVDPFQQKRVFNYEIDQTFYRVLTFDYVSESSLISQIKLALFDIKDTLNRNSNGDIKKIVFVLNNDYEKNEKIHNLFKEYIDDFFANDDVEISLMKVIDFVDGNKKIV